MLPKEIFAFVLIEYIQTKDYSPSHLGAKKIIYSNGSNEISFNRNQFAIPIEQIQETLLKVGLDFENFKSFCEDFMQSPDFNIVMKSSLIKPR